MICPKCQSYCLHHPEVKFTRMWKKCVTCGFCQRIPELKSVDDKEKHEEPEE